MCMSFSCRLCLWCVLCVWYFMRDVLCLQHHEICGRFVVFSLLCIKCVVFVVHRVCMGCVCSGCMWCSGCVECVCFVCRLLVCLAETVPKCACTSSGVCGCRTRGAFNPELGLRRGCVIIFWRSVTLGSIYEVVRQLSSFSLPTHFKRFPTYTHSNQTHIQDPGSITSINISQVQG